MKLVCLKHAEDPLAHTHTVRTHTAHCTIQFLLISCNHYILRRHCCRCNHTHRPVHKTHSKAHSDVTVTALPHTCMDAHTQSRLYPGASIIQASGLSFVRKSGFRPLFLFCSHSLSVLTSVRDASIKQSGAEQQINPEWYPRLTAGAEETSRRSDIHTHNI